MKLAVQPAWQLELGRRWSEPHRHHHDLEHLREVLDALEGLASDGLEFDLTLVRRAAWFHDAVYDVHRDDNEERSAALALRMLPTSSKRDEVARLVMVTKDHVVGPDDRDGAALCDADLSVLAGTAERYGRYADAIRLEYEHVPDAQYRRARARVLTDLLAHDPLYA
ncbi:MAG: HD domain-containing protein, partial [Nocardioidaceae bacterium]